VFPRDPAFDAPLSHPELLAELARETASLGDFLG